MVGLLGFVDLVGGTTSQTGNVLLGIFGVTLLHNIVHLAVGVAFLVGSSSDDNAKKTSLAIGVVYLLVGVIGFLGIDAINDLLFINLADNLLHIGTGALALVVGLGKLDEAFA